MIVPTALDIIRSIEATIIAKVEPEITGTRGLSATATIRHLLRNVAVRLEKEGQILMDDCARQRALLGRIGSYLADISLAPEADEVLRHIQAAANAPPYEPCLYPTLEVMAQEAIGLRNTLHRSLELLHKLAADAENDAAYLDLRQDIRHYIEWQLAAEHSLIAPAFFGQGPRR